jgi:hypothetical protein
MVETSPLHPQKKNSATPTLVGGGETLVKGALIQERCLYNFVLNPGIIYLKIEAFMVF